MLCQCEVDLPPDWNYCPVCAGANADKKLVNDKVFCDKCGRIIRIKDNYCWFCREPNRFKIAAIIFKLEDES